MSIADESVNAAEDAMAFHRSHAESSRDILQRKRASIESSGFFPQTGFLYKSVSCNDQSSPSTASQSRLNRHQPESKTPPLAKASLGILPTSELNQGSYSVCSSLPPPSRQRRSHNARSQSASTYDVGAFPSSMNGGTFDCVEQFLGPTTDVSLDVVPSAGDAMARRISRDLFSAAGNGSSVSLSHATRSSVESAQPRNTGGHVYNEVGSRDAVNFAASARLDGGEGIEEAEISRRMEVLITHVESPHEFYFQIKEDRLRIESMARELSESVKRSLMRPQRLCCEGDNVAVLGYVMHFGKRKRLWCRGIVVRSLSAGRCSVRLVDYGGVVELQSTDVRSVVDLHLVDRHEFAVKAKLSGIAPVKGNQWVAEATDYFAQVVFSVPEVVLNVKRRLCGDDSLTVALLLQRSNETTYVDIAELLIMKGFARRTTAEVSSTNPVVSRDVQPQIYARGSTRDSTLTWPTFVRPVKKKFKALVTYVDEAGVIWATVDHKHRSNMLEKLNHGLTKAMSDTNPPKREELDALILGQAITAQYPREKLSRWYRASFCGWASSSKNSLNVRYIDFGDSSTVGVDQVRLKIPSSFSNVPQVSLWIRLFAVAPINDSWSSESLNFLYDRLVGQTVFVSQPNCYQKVYERSIVANVSLPDSGDVSEMLLKRGYAMECSDDRATTTDWTPVASKSAASRFSTMVDRLSGLDSQIRQAFGERGEANSLSDAITPKDHFTESSRCPSASRLQIGLSSNASESQAVLQKRSTPPSLRLTSIVESYQENMTATPVAAGVERPVSVNEDDVKTDYNEETSNASLDCVTFTDLSFSVHEITMTPNISAHRVPPTILRNDVECCDKAASVSSVLDTTVTLMAPSNAVLPEISVDSGVASFEISTAETTDFSVGTASSSSDLDLLAIDRSPTKFSLLDGGRSKRRDSVSKSLTHERMLTANLEKKMYELSEDFFSDDDGDSHGGSDDNNTKNYADNNNNNNNNDNLGGRRCTPGYGQRPLSAFGITETIPHSSFFAEDSAGTTPFGAGRENSGLYPGDTSISRQRSGFDGAEADYTDKNTHGASSSDMHCTIMRPSMVVHPANYSPNVSVRSSSLPVIDANLISVKSRSSSSGGASTKSGIFRASNGRTVGDRGSNISDKSASQEGLELSKGQMNTSTNHLNTQFDSDPRPSPSISPTSDEGIIEDVDGEIVFDKCGDAVDKGCFNECMEDGILWSPIMMRPTQPSSKHGFITSGSFWNMSVPEGIDFCYEITQWESGRIFHFRYSLDENNDLVRGIEPDGKRRTKITTEGGYDVEVKEQTKTFDPQIKVNCVMAKLFQSHMQAQAGFWPLVEKPFVGLPCAVKWSKDVAWYRAVVVKVLASHDTHDGDSLVVVQFVDFGNRDFASVRDLRLLPIDALIPPVLATRAKVHGLQNEFGKAVFDYVHSNTVERSLHGILKGAWKDSVTGQVVPEITVWKLRSQKFALKKLVDVGILHYAPCYEERGYLKAKELGKC